MKNMYSTPLRYKNFNDVEKNTTLYFHITPREFADWAMENPDILNELNENLAQAGEFVEGENRNLTQTELATVLRVVKILAEISAGRPSDDGEYFVRDPKFKYSAAYNGFRLFLFEHPKEIEVFFQAILNTEVMTEFNAIISKGVDSINETQELPQPELKDATQLSRDELIERMKQLEASKQQ